MLGTLLGLNNCTTNPATGKKSFTAFMSREDEVRIGTEEHPRLIKEFGGIKVDGHSIATFRDIEIRDIALHPGAYGMLFSASAGGSERVDQVRCENVIIDGL